MRGDQPVEPQGAVASPVDEGAGRHG
jgi:hypothetical protein